VKKKLYQLLNIPPLSRRPHQIAESNVADSTRSRSVKIFVALLNLKTHSHS
jgi:hypothetical protein